MKTLMALMTLLTFSSVGLNNQSIELAKRGRHSHKWTNSSDTIQLAKLHRKAKPKMSNKEIETV